MKEWEFWRNWLANFNLILEKLHFECDGMDSLDEFDEIPVQLIGNSLEISMCSTGFIELILINGPIVSILFSNFTGQKQKNGSID